MVELGDEVKDMVSGFCGVVIARYTYLQGCSRVEVQPLVGEDRKLPERAVFDEPLVELVTAGKVKPVDWEDPGGPKDHSPISRR